MTVRHVLFDADGVLQDLPGGWYAAMEPYLGERAREFLHETWKDELPMLAGRGDYMPLLAATLMRYGVVQPVEVVYADVWHRIELIEESISLVHQLRTSGYGVHLATNQERYRGAYMREVLGYDDLFDVSCYSYDLGVAKPDAGFFLEAARRIGARPRRSCSSTTAHPMSRPRARWGCRRCTGPSNAGTRSCWRVWPTTG